jgi:hypothetical protein
MSIANPASEFKLLKKQKFAFDTSALQVVSAVVARAVALSAT